MTKWNSHLIVFLIMGILLTSIYQEGAKYILSLFNSQKQKIYIKYTPENIFFKQTLGLYYLRSSIMKENGLYGLQLPDNDDYNLSALVYNRTNYFEERRKKLLTNVSKHKSRRFRIETCIKYVQDEFPNTLLARNLEYKHVNRSTALRNGFCSEPNFSRIFWYKISIHLNMGTKQWNITVFEHVHDHQSKSSVPSYIFGIISTPTLRSMCQTYIHSNPINRRTPRKYSILCPLKGTKGRIAVLSSYGEMSLYEYKCPGNQLHLLYDEVVPRVKSQNNTIVLHDSLSMYHCGPEVIKHHPGFWLKIRGIWHWSTNSCYFPFTLSSTFRKCLKSRKDRIILIGDSHVREQRDALYKYYEIWMEYRMTTISPSLADEMNTMQNSFNNDSILFLNAGPWDLKHMELISYITGMTDLFEVINYLKASKPNITIIWLETTAHPYTSHERFNINPIIDGLNQWVNHHMKKLGVKIISYFDISIPMEAFSRDGIHFHILMNDDVATNTSIVSVGGAMMSILLRHLCN